MSAKFTAPRRIRPEDFKQDQKKTAGIIGGAINEFLNQVFTALSNGKLGFTNMNRRVQDITVDIDGSGNIIGDVPIAGNLDGIVIGWNVIQSTNINDPTTFPTSHPHISATLTGDILTVDNISGLQNNSKYRLKIELIGE